MHTSTNTIVTRLGLAAILQAGLLTFADPVQLSQLPAAAQQSINAVRNSARIQSIEQVTREGKLAYEVRLDRPTALNHFYVTETGVVRPLEDFPARPPLAEASKVQFGQLPMPVLSTIQTYAGASFISDLEKGTIDGRTVYQASFRYHGRPVELRVFDDGSLMKDLPNAIFLAQYNRELGLPPAAGVGAAPTGESHSATGAGGGVTPTNNPSPAR